MQYVANYSKVVASLRTDLKERDIAYIEKELLTINGAKEVARDLYLEVVFNDVTELYCFRKQKELNLNEKD